MIEILYVEDDRKLGTIVSNSLLSKGYRVRLCTDGEEAWKSFQLNKPDIVVLDIMMPKMDGFTLMKEIRSYDTVTPVLFLSARSDVEDVLQGFDLGGNDYLKKPFDINELIARIVALVKMCKKFNPPDLIKIGKYNFNPVKQMLSYNYQHIHLSYRESEILKRFYERRNSVVPRNEIIFEFWDHSTITAGRSLDVFVSRLRKYLKEDPDIKIVNVRHVGYQLKIG